MSTTTATGKARDYASEKQMAAALQRLAKHKKAWIGLNLQARIDYLARLMKAFKEVAEPWVNAALIAKGIERNSAREAEEWLAGPYTVMRNLRLLHRSLSQIKLYGTPRIPGKVRKVGDRVACEVFPGDTYDGLFFMGTKAEVWLPEGTDPNNLKNHMAKHYREEHHQGEISLVLGGGNVASIGPMDALYKLFVEKKVVIIKTHPVNDYLGPFWEKGFAPLIQDGYLEIVYGDAAEGAFLCKHDLVDEIHITGSDRTHDIIVFGPNPEKAKKARKPVLKKPITSELGNVSPVIVVPGPWSASDIAFQAENITTSLANNAGFNCNASRILLLQENWILREDLINAVRENFGKLTTRPAYYPGAHKRFEAFHEQHPKAELFGEKDEDHLPWTIITNLDPDKKDDICFQTEAFCSLFAETPLSAKSPADFIEKAVAFANNTLWGTLNATILIHPSSLRDEQTREAYEKAIVDLRYGTVAVNHWAAVGYGMSEATWGAYPGHDIYDVRSGIGVVHNALLFDEPEKSVIYGPFRPWPKPPWFHGHSRGHHLGKKLVDFEADPSVLRLPGIFYHALLG